MAGYEAEYEVLDGSVVRGPLNTNHSFFWDTLYMIVTLSLVCGDCGEDLNIYLFFSLHRWTLIRYCFP